jgi:glycosyltransferase involved in cell wall biosynthesis
MRLGLIARADATGLGYQTLEFYRHMPVDKTLVVDISDLNKNPIHTDWYPDAQYVKGMLSNDAVRSFLQDLDVVFIAEAAYNPSFYDIARQMGVKTAVQYNYEFFDWLDGVGLPDMFIAPSTWHYEEVDALAKRHGKKHKYLHVPVDREAVPFRERKLARTFFHSAGKSAAMDRNGTKTVIEASKYLKTNAQIFVHFQGDQGLAHQATMTTKDYMDFLEVFGDSSKCTISVQPAAHYADLYTIGDVMVLPRRYGGNCLPVNEALSSGMPVIMPNISPNNTFLAHEWMLPAFKVEEFTPRTQVDVYEVSAHALAAMIDRFYMMDEEHMASQSRRADILADTISWEAMTQRYLDAFEELVHG